MMNEILRNILNGIGFAAIWWIGLLLSTIGVGLLVAFIGGWRHWDTAEELAIISVPIGGLIYVTLSAIFLISL